MEIKLHRNFEKQYKKLSDSLKQKFKERRNLFLRNQFDPILNNHALTGKYGGFRSINITGDIRVIFKKDGENAIFITIGSHSRLYG